MRGTLITMMVLCGAAILMLAVVGTTGAAGRSGEDLFKEHCAACHPGGGNIINPKKTLHGKDMRTNNVASAQDIVRLTRNPGPGMLKFDAKTLPDKDAQAIAQYVLSTFGKE